MAKRFTDTNKYKNPFFRGLQGAYKLLWDYLCHDCDNAGIWIKDFEAAQMYLGPDMKVSEARALELFNGRVQVFAKGTKWFIPSFIEFQYDCKPEELSTKNNAHNSVLKKLTKEGLMSPSRGAQDKDKSKDKDLDKDKYKAKDSGESETLANVEFWTDQVISGNDALFTNLVNNNDLHVNGSLEEFSKDHLGLCSRYGWHEKMTTQQSFRISLLNYMKESLKEGKQKSNGIDPGKMQKFKDL